MRSMTSDDLATLSVGASFLGAGGGGDPYIGTLMARQALDDKGSVTVVDLPEVPDDAMCAMSAVMGAPTVLVEKLPGGNEQIAALAALERHLGREITHVMCAEIGGLNSTLPIVTAAQLGKPLIDCDAMGRAFPEIQMSTPTLYGIGASPIALADDKGNRVLIEAVDNHWTERLARSATIDMGAAAFIALFAQTGEEVKRSMIGGSLTRAQSIGSAILEARRVKADPIEAARRASGGYTLFQGKIVDVERRTQAGFARGAVLIEGTETDAGTSLEIGFQNENLKAELAGGHTIATVPDLIVILETETGTPVTTEELRYGFRVTVLGVPCDRRWRSPAGLELVGPGYFDLDVDYVPIEDLHRGDTAHG